MAEISEEAGSASAVLGAERPERVVAALVTAGVAYPWGFYAFTLAAVLAAITLATVPAHAHGVD